MGGADERAAVGVAACAAAGGRGLPSGPPSWAWGVAGERGGRFGSLGAAIALSGVPMLGGPLNRRMLALAGGD